MTGAVFASSEKSSLRAALRSAVGALGCSLASGGAAAPLSVAVAGETGAGGSVTGGRGLAGATVGQAFAGSGGGMGGTGRCAGPLWVTSTRPMPPVVPLARTGAPGRSAVGACAWAIAARAWAWVIAAGGSAAGATAGTGGAAADVTTCAAMDAAGRLGTGASDGVACAGIVASTGAEAGRSGAIPRTSGWRRDP
jgi:hypothetical protein